jgi:hypothetical protein
MVLLPPSEGRRDPERSEAARRQRVRFARDVGDEAGLAWAHEPRRRRSRFTIGTVVVLVLFAGLGAVPMLLADSDGLLRPDCATPGLVSAPDEVGPGTDFAWQIAGPESGSYVVTIDAPEVTGTAAGGASVAGGRILGGPMALPGCRSQQLLATAPEQTGTHEITLFRRAGARWERAAVTLLRVS